MNCTGSAICFPRRRLLLVWETDYFEANWQDSFRSDNDPRLKRIKQKYDPDGLFFLHYGVGSETGAPTDSPGSKLAESKRGIDVWRGLATVSTNRWGS